MKTTKLKVLTLTMAAFAIGSTFTSCKKEKGCTDPTACNYESGAEKDDGSCEYTSCAGTDNSTDYVQSIGGGSDTIITVTDHGQGTGTMTWTSNRTWVLDGFVYVNSGQTLTIEPGTVIKGASGAGETASALIVAKGATINACGTSSQPIIFTAEADQLNGNIPSMTRGLWGGLIVLGSATLNSTPGTTSIEGIPTSEPRGIYGGSDDNDNSGSLCYLSIRHGGTDIGAGNEINGLTLGGVGAGTVIHHIEVISNNDDGIEFFGGTAEVKHAVVAFCKDDGFDYDEGFRGKGQFWVNVTDPSAGDRGGEHDGGTSPEDGTPYAHPVIYNATYIGRGISAGSRALTLRDNAGGEYHNSIFVQWGKGFDIENLASGEDSYNRFAEGNIVFAGNMFYDCVVAGTGATAVDLFLVAGAEAGQDAAFQATFATNNNTIADPGISTTISTSGGLDPVPTGSVTGATAPSGGFYDAVTYRGAFDPSGLNWMLGWTLLDDAGYLQ